MTREEIESGLVYARTALTARMRENDADGAANVAMALLALDAARSLALGGTKSRAATFSPSAAPSVAPAFAVVSAPEERSAKNSDANAEPWIINFEDAKRALAQRPQACEPRGDASPLRRTALRLYRED